MKKPLRSALLAPLKAFSELKLLGVLLLANLFTALIQSTPLLVPALLRFGHSLSGRGQPFPSAEAMADFGKLLGEGGGPFLLGPLGLGLLLSIALQPVLAGGIVGRLCTAGRFSLAHFARDCVAQLGRNLRLLGWALLGLVPVVALAVLAAVLLTLLEKPTLFTLEGEQGVLDNPFTFWSVAHLAWVGVLFALWRASFDLARVQLFVEDQRKTRLAAWRALKHLVRAPGAILGYLVLGAVGLLVMLALARLRASVEVNSVSRAWLALLLAQGVILARLGFSVASTAFAVDLHRAMPPPPAPKPAASEAPPAAHPETAAPGAPLPGATLPGTPPPEAPPTGAVSPEAPSTEARGEPTPETPPEPGSGNGPRSA